MLDQRNRLSERARDLFQESRLYYLHLWKALDPWRDPEISIPACLQMQSRYVVCANGEIDAEFLLEDPGAFRSAVGGIAAAMRDHMEMDPVRCFRARSDAACAKDHGTGVLFQADIEGLLKQIRLAFDVTRVTAQRLTARTGDADLPRDLGVSAVDVVRAARAAHEEGGADVFLARAAT